LKIRYTGPAARQIDAILAYIKSRSPDGTANVLSRIGEALSIAAEQPRIGQSTSRPGFRRTVINPCPSSNPALTSVPMNDNRTAQSFNFGLKPD
jgi:plasmid stabilization system protein ParE